MKKLLAGILATSACFAAFTACNKKVKTDVEGAAAYLEAMYMDVEEEGRVDYEMVNSLTLQGYTYTITWAVESDEEGVDDISKYVKLEQKEVVVDEKTTTVTKVDVDEVSLIEVDYILTATVSDGKGNTKEVEFFRTLTAAPSEVAAPITAAPVEGTSYKFYVYQEATGKDCYINGAMKNTYYFASTEEYEEGIDLYVTNVEGGFHLYYNKESAVEGEEAVKTYINVVKSGTHINAKYETAPSTVWTFDAEYGTIVATVDETKYYLGCDGTYDTVEPQSKREAGYYMGYLVTLVDRSEITDDYKVEQTLREVSLDAVYVGNQTLTLAEQGSRFGEVELTWTVKSGTGAAVNGETLTLTAGTAASDIVLTATAKRGEVTDSVDVAIKVIPNDAAIIAEAAHTLKAGQSFANEVTLTGIVTEAEEYSTEHQNITITMLVEGKKIDAYRLVGSGAETLAKGYTVTVKGILTNYQGTIQFAQACEIVGDVIPGDESNLPETPTMTPAEIIDAAYALAEGASLDGTYTLTGKITKIDTPYDSGYKNISVTIAVEGKEDKPMLCYRMKGDGADQLAVGDTITVTGTIKNHYGKIEFNSGCTFTDRVAGEGGGVTPPDGGETNPPAQDNPAIAITAAPVAGTAYKFFLYQKNEAKNYYLAGGMNGYYLATTDDPAAAIDVYVEATEGGFYMYYMNAEVKTYINAVVSGTHINGKYDTTASSVWTFDETLKTMVTTLADKQYYLGTYGDYNTMGPSSIDKASTSYVGCLCTLKEGSVTPPDGGNEGGEVTPPESGEVVETTTYKMYLRQVTLSKIFFLDGGTDDGEYLTTTEDASKAVDIIAEKLSTGAYLFHYVDASGAKQYITLYTNAENKVKVHYTTTGTAFTYNVTINAYVSTVSGTEYALGTYSNYTTISASKSSHLTAENTGVSQFPAQLIAPDKIAEIPAFGGGEVTPPEGGEGGEGGEEVVSDLQEGVAYTVSANNANGPLYLLGTITSGRWNCSTNAADAVSVYVENVTGGQLLYFYSNSVKTYVMFNSSASSKTASAATTTNASEASIFVWNATLHTLVIPDINRGFGAQDTSTYENLSFYSTTNTSGYNWGAFTAVTTA